MKAALPAYLPLLSVIAIRSQAKQARIATHRIAWRANPVGVGRALDHLATRASCLECMIDLGQAHFNYGLVNYTSDCLNC